MSIDIATTEQRIYITGMDAARALTELVNISNRMRNAVDFAFTQVKQMEYSIASWKRSPEGMRESHMRVAVEAFEWAQGQIYNANACMQKLPPAAQDIWRPMLTEVLARFNAADRDLAGIRDGA